MADADNREGPKPPAAPREKGSQAVPAEPGRPVLPAKPGMTPEAEAAVAAAAAASGKPVAPGSPASGTTGVAGEPRPVYARITPAAPGTIPAPLKPSPAPAEDPRADEIALSRRMFLGLVPWSTLGWAAFTGASAAGTVLTARFMFPNVLYEPPATVKVGVREDYPDGFVEERFKDTHGLWVVRSGGRIFALVTICTHLGCTPNWLQNEGKFKCPCHGSGFRMSGIHFEGPAPRPLERAAIRLLDDGQMLVDKARRFLFEKGQWDDPESYVVV